MPLTLVLGPANSAKAGEVLGAFAVAARRGAVLVVPTAQDAEHYTRELAGDGAMLGSVLTFSGLAAEIARRADYGGRRLSALQREHLIGRVVSRLDFRVLAGSAAAPGFAAATGALIAELQRSLITPQRFAQALSAWAAQDERRADYAQDVASLYLAYARELERRERVDAELFAWRAIDALRAEPGRWGETSVFVYGFDDLTAIERDVIETLARIVGVDVTVSLTYEPQRAALSARAEVVQELRTFAARVEQLPPLQEHYAPQAREALHHLERGLFEPGAERVDPGGAVTLLEAGGERAEAELIAGEVVRLVRDGVPPEEIVVVARSLPRVQALFTGVFRRYGIALAGSGRVPFTHTRLGRSVRALARCALLGDAQASAADLLDVLRAPGRLERPELADALEAEVRREALRTAGQARARLDFELAEIAALRDADDPAAELARQAWRQFAAPYRGRADALDAAGRLDAAALAALTKAITELGELGERPSGPELLTLIDELEVTAGEPPRPGAVLLAEPLAVRARRFRAVLVCGLGEGEFPLPGTSEPFLSDEHRREIALASGLRLPATEDALARERYLFYACVSRATERVSFSYRSSDEEGNLALPSPFIADVADLYIPEWTERRTQRLLADVTWSAQDAPTARERARAHAAAGPPSVSPEGVVQPISPAALTHVRHRQVVSGGALEIYADCPVRWLVERQLSPAPLDPDPEPMVRGSYMHETLEDLFARLGEPLTPETLPGALRILADIVAEVPPTIAPGRGEAVRTAVLETIVADLRRYLAAEARDGCAWEPSLLELRFGFDGEEGALPPLVLGEGDERVVVRGVIDRIDVEPGASGRAIVRDYKSGSARPEHAGARWALDRRLQVALYMLAVRELLRLDPVAGLYQPLSGQNLRPRGMFRRDVELGSRVLTGDARDPEELDEVLADAARRAIEIAGRLRRGELEPCPQTCGRDGCRYPGICRVT
jgi:ATP-dependent helicase/DNAse subunit B